MDLSTIEAKAERYAATRRELEDAVLDLDQEVSGLKRRRLPRIKRLVEKAANQHNDLSAAIDDGRALFKRPRSRLFHGIRAGLRKRRGKITWISAEAVVARIKKHLPAQADTLIKTKETPRKEALEGLPAADLKRLGVTVTEAGDEIFINPTDSDVDKLVEALLEDKESGSK